LSTVSSAIDQREIRLNRSAGAVVRGLRRSGAPQLYLDGAGEFAEGWGVPGLIAVDPEICLSRVCAAPGEGRAALDDLSSILRERRAAGGTAETGVAALLAYELFLGNAPAEPPAPRLIALGVDRSVRHRADGASLLTFRRLAGQRAEGSRLHDEVLRRVAAEEKELPRPPAVRTGEPRTSLPREAYLDAVVQVKKRIAAGDVYQANLCQRFTVDYDGDGAAKVVRLLKPSRRK
jgi:anthranilate/para-aminobenzoate synthase component I